MTNNENKNTINSLKDLGSSLKDAASSFAKMQFTDPKNTATGFRKGKRAQKEIAKYFDPVPRNQAGLLVAGALDKALAECKSKVESIAGRDIEFDLEKDQYLCRYGLLGNAEGQPEAAVKRVTEIFDKPVFFGPDGPNASDIRQGELGNCWFLAALSAVSTVPGLVEKFCVARDEEVGVYGFIFFRDCYWQPVIVDDLLFWSPPKFDELTPSEKVLYYNDRDMYHQVAEKTGKGLKYARSGNVGETWVPLIEKAYAKLHGDYASLEGGFLSDAIEDLTGGVATSFQMADLLNPAKFWDDELQHAGLKTHLFGVTFHMNEARSEVAKPTVQGLIPSHAYSVLRARESKGKRFVVIRNPWGDSEWTGPWADGSKEWKGKWFQVLDELQHEFGDDGKFVMEYSDFLSVFGQIDRATLFDASWVMSSIWLHITPQPIFHPWTYGDAYYYFTLKQPSPSVIVLSQTDHRYFNRLNGEDPWWLLDFLVYRKGLFEPVLVGMSGVSLGSQRSVSCELYLQAGDYIVLPRMEPRAQGSVKMREDGDQWGTHKLSRMLTERAKSHSVARNYDIRREIQYIPISPDVALVLDGIAERGTSSETEDADENGDDEKKVTGDTKKADAGSKGNSDNGSGPTPDPLFLGLRVYTQNGAITTESSERVLTSLSNREKTLSQSDLNGH
ncbi:hypothetical protein BJ912DRAFT_1085652 [Pholiota molesta]|nr:hypothetical protein BJ912DRAFT_1085652 [Pholiota molesta]